MTLFIACLEMCFLLLRGTAWREHGFKCSPPVPWLFIFPVTYFRASGPVLPCDYSLYRFPHLGLCSDPGSNPLALSKCQAVQLASRLAGLLHLRQLCGLTARDGASTSSAALSPQSDRASLWRVLGFFSSRRFLGKPGRCRMKKVTRY